jgi:hypothetical protein
VNRSNTMTSQLAGRANEDRGIAACGSKTAQRVPRKHPGQPVAPGVLAFVDRLSICARSNPSSPRSSCTASRWTDLIRNSRCPNGAGTLARASASFAGSYPSPMDVAPAAMASGKRRRELDRCEPSATVLMRGHPGLPGAPVARSLYRPSSTTSAELVLSSAARCRLGGSLAHASRHRNHESAHSRSSFPPSGFSVKLSGTRSKGATPKPLSAGVTAKRSCRKWAADDEHGRRLRASIARMASGRARCRASDLRRPPCSTCSLCTTICAPHVALALARRARRHFKAEPTRPPPGWFPPSLCRRRSTPKPGLAAPRFITISLSRGGWRGGVDVRAFQGPGFIDEEMIAHAF